MRLHERVAALNRVPIFVTLNPVTLERLAQSCTWRNYAASEQILDNQDPSTDLLFLLAGKARVINYSADGKSVVFVDLVAPALFGEIAAIDRGPRSAGVEALEGCTIASLSAQGLEQL